MRVAALAPLVAAAILAVPWASAAPLSVEADEVAPCGIVTNPVCWFVTFYCYFDSGGDPGPHACCWDVYKECICVNCNPGAEPTIGRDAKATCENEGVQTMVTVFGHNYHCKGRECVNGGIIVFVGATESCYGSGPAGVCAGEDCVWAPGPRP
jgi:hypothetical protein